VCVCVCVCTVYIQYSNINCDTHIFNFVNGFRLYTVAATGNLYQ